MYGIEPAAMETKGMSVEKGRLLQATDKNMLVLGGMIGDGFQDPNGESSYYTGENETWEEYQARIYEKTLALMDKKIVAEFMNYETQKSKKVTVSGGRCVAQGQQQ